MTSDDFKHKDFYTVALLSSEDPFDTAPLRLKSIKLLFLSPEHSVFSVYDVPPTLVFDMPGKFGEEELSKSFALGTMEFSLSDGQQFTASFRPSLTVLQNLIGTKIDRFVIV